MRVLAWRGMASHLGMQLKVWLVALSRLGMQLKDPVSKKLCIHLRIVPSAVLALSVSLL